MYRNTRGSATQTPTLIPRTASATPSVRAPTPSTSGISSLSALLTYESDSETPELGTETEFGDRDSDENGEETPTHTNTDIEDEKASHERTPVFSPTLISLRLNDYLEMAPETPDSHKIDSAIESGFCHRRRTPRIFL